MFRPGNTEHLWIAIAVTASAITAGCAPLRLPAIDPTGQRIFLPAPNSTTLAVADPLPAPHLPRPAFTAPPVPPPCPFPNVAPPAFTTSLPVGGGTRPGCTIGSGQPGGTGHHGTLKQSLHDHFHPERRGQIALLPKKVVAPVGGEVVLLSGIFGADGHLVKREDLQWVLSQGSVGHFVEVGGHEKHLLPGFRSNAEKLTSTDFARSRTTAKPRLLTRGTAGAADDIALLAGQGWVTVTSPSEGVSHVTVMAPDAEIWDQRRETATIYWVDARWDLPPAENVPAGQPHLLQTRVVRNSAGAPAEGWVVRYELAEGSSASFLPSGGQAAEVLVDPAGLASVQIQSAAGGSETARVRVQIIRPAELGDGLPRMTVGQGWTSVTWTAPGLVLQADGPPSARPGETLTYQVQVFNPGNLVTPGVVVKDEAPAGLVLLGSDPPAEQFGQMHQWPLGDLAPGQAARITIQCRLELDRTVRYGFRAESADGLTARDDVETIVQRPALALDMQGPERAEVGERVTYEVHVRNTSGQDLADVVVTDTFDPGLRQTEGAASPIRRRLGPLAADQVQSFAVSFVVEQPGTLCHTLEATAPDGFTARSRACLEAVAPQPVPQPGVDVEISGPEQQQVGQFALYNARITNTGNIPLTGVRIVLAYAPQLLPRQASGGYRAEPGQFVWVVNQLDPGRSEIRQINCLCQAAADPAEVRAEVASADQVSDSDTARTRIVAPPAANPPVREPGPTPGTPAQPGTVPPDTGTAGEPPAEPVPGELQLSLTDAQDPIPLGGQTTYLIVIANERDVVDRNVKLTVRLPEGLDLIRVQGPVGVRASGDNGRTIEMTPINTLRAREKLRPFRIEVRGVRAGEFTFQAEATSQLAPQPIQRSEATTVLQ